MERFLIQNSLSSIAFPCRPFTKRLGISQVRGYAKPAEVSEFDDEEEPPIPISPRVRKLAEEIMHLNLLEVADLTDILQKRLNITPGFAGMPMLPGPMPGKLYELTVNKAYVKAQQHI